MADQKISALPAVTMPLAETEVLPIVQSSTTKKVTVAELTTLIKHTMTMDNTNALQFGVGGVTASINYNGDGSLRIKPRAGYPLQIDQANIKISDAGYGIDFSANASAPGMTSELLNDYEEGEITDYGISFDSLSTGITYASGRRNGKYTKIGRTVYFNGRIELTSKGSATGAARITGLPFAKDSTYNGGIQLYFYYGLSSVTTQPWAIIENSATTAVLKVPGAGATVDLTDANFNNDTEILFNGFYFV